MLTQVNAGRERLKVLAPIEIPAHTLTSARFAGIMSPDLYETQTPICLPGYGLIKPALAGPHAGLPAI